MGEQIKKTKNELVGRWQQKMPRFFYWLMVVAVGIGVTATAINMYVPATGGILPDWWVGIYPFITGMCLGVAIGSKFTCDGGFRDKIIEKFTQRTILDKDDN